MEINVIMPMMGKGERMRGLQETIKPLIKTRTGKPLWLHALSSLSKYTINNLVTVVPDDYSKQFEISLPCKSHKNLAVPFQTKHHVETVSIAVDYLLNNNPSMPVLVLDCDIESDLPTVTLMENEKAHLFTFNTETQNKSFVLEKDGWVSEIVEKVPISNDAVFGAYLFDSVKTLDYLISNSDSEFMSGLVKKLIDENQLVGVTKLANVTNYGTLEEFLEAENE